MEKSSIFVAYTQSLPDQLGNACLRTQKITIFINLSTTNN